HPSASPRWPADGRAGALVVGPGLGADQRPAGTAAGFSGRRAASEPTPSRGGTTYRDVPGPAFSSDVPGPAYRADVRCAIGAAAHELDSHSYLGQDGTCLE